MPVNNKWWVAQKMHTLKAYNYHWHCSRQNYPPFLPKTFWRLWLASWTLRILMQTQNWLDNFAITLHTNSQKSMSSLAVILAYVMFACFKTYVDRDFWIILRIFVLKVRGTYFQIIMNIQLVPCQCERHIPKKLNNLTL